MGYSLHGHVFLMSIFPGPRPKMGKSTFEDLLPEGSSFTKKDDEPKTIGEMKKKTMAEETDPIKLKVNEPPHCLRSLQSGLTQTCMSRHGRWFEKRRNCTICEAKTKVQLLHS